MIELREKIQASRRDFRVSYLKKEGSNIHILLGPKFAPVLAGKILSRVSPQIFPYQTSKVGFNDVSEKDGRTYISGSHDPQTAFVDFYSPESTGRHIDLFLFKYLSDRGRGKEISKYSPSRLDKDKNIIHDSGEFIVPNKALTYFWMKIPFRGKWAGASSAGIAGPFTDKDLNENWMRIESGPSIPNNLPFRYNQQGQLQYTLFIPIFSIHPKIGNQNELKVDLEYYEFGDIQYFSDLLVQDKKERAFIYSSIAQK